MVLTKAIKKLKDYGTLVMFQHTIFSISFALVSLLLASSGLPKLYSFGFIILALLSARTGANAINRVIDAEIDAKNPRTKNRQLPQGLMEKNEIIMFTIICFMIMVFSAFMLNPLCAILSPVALFFMVIYSYTKRFTSLCHVVLGITCAIAPMGSWLAITGEFALIPFFLSSANALWVAGFDIIYGAQDVDFDRHNGIYSIPAKFGIKNGLYISTAFHILAVISLIIVGVISKELGIIYYVGVVVISALLIFEHIIVKPDNLSHAKLASYSVNEVVSIVFIIFSTTDILMK